VSSFDASRGNSVARQLPATDISDEKDWRAAFSGNLHAEGGRWARIARNIAATSTAAKSQMSNRVVSLVDEEHARSFAHRVCARLFQLCTVPACRRLPICAGGETRYNDCSLQT